AARGAQRIALLRREQRQTDRLRRLDHGGLVRQEQEVRLDQPPEWIRNTGGTPLAAEHRREHLGCSLAAVRDRHRVHLQALSTAQPRGERSGRLRGAEDALEASRARDYAHALPRRPPARAVEAAR